ncbi:MAG: hypothetical protein OMM_04780 [Candidatus Magnetoglobus multicellularis str. Araruama]|uniref:Uncharacterized protein n=1 Tax=Candidatus Magnetoglobus multicellularis str. Araruama TaxID=890399 RepID=A0A1V1NZR8_9BACT|nr:MAG: hypothetical protein OMM_04780 [Candidatus Magnetoglobus multicellularis str. Araruama]
MQKNTEKTVVHIYNDVAFKWLFGREKESRPLTKLLNAVVAHDGLGPGFSEIEIKNPYDESQPLSKQKQGILDIRAKDKETGIWFDLEMEASSFTYYPNRSLYYLTGMYRDQLPKGRDNYYELRPCFGIHLLKSDIFFGDDCSDWFHHFGMLNYKTHKQLNNHLELYYVELNKFLKAVKNKTIKWGELEQWSDYIAKPQDPSKSLPEYLKTNQEIKEVHEMLRTFTQNDQLQEQYRLHEEWLRVQRTERYAKQKLQQDYVHALKMKEEAEREKFQAFFLLQEKDVAIQEKDVAIKEKDQEINRLKKIAQIKDRWHSILRSRFRGNIVKF